jgi:hypothetical protein
MITRLMQAEKSAEDVESNHSPSFNQKNRPSKLGENNELFARKR